MAIREIVKYGDPRLVAKNLDVEEFDDPGLAALLQDLKETCWAAPGLGLAAPQVGVNLRVAIVDLSVGKDPSQVLVLVNPVVVDAQGLVRDEEGCLSFPDLVETVERPEKVTVEALDETREEADVRRARTFSRGRSVTRWTTSTRGSSSTGSRR